MREGNQRGKSGGTGMRAVIGFVALLLVAAVLLRSPLCAVSVVNVKGARGIPVETIRKLAGLSGVNFFSVSEESVRESLSQNRYLDFISLEKHFPNAVTLTVRERTACGNLIYMGSQYIIDEEGRVLEKLSQQNLDNGCVYLSGLQPLSVYPGAEMVCQKEAALTAYRALMGEILLQGVLHEFSELNAGDLDNLYLVTVDGYTILMGDSSDAQAKIGTVRAVIAKLREMGNTGGEIDASVPGKATYSP